jgi:pimeloyl-ACP methyl ester carboxylesterase
MARPRLPRPLLAAAAATAGGAWYATFRRDRDRIRRDPIRPALRRDLAELGGETLGVPAGDGTRLRVRVVGPQDAPTVVLVHGWTCALEFWTLQLQALAGELRIVAYDLRGHGGSAPSSGGDYSIDAYADDLERVLRATVPEGRRATLVGHSLGAMTIAAWAGDRDAAEIRERVAAVGLLSTGLGDLISSSLILPTHGLGDRIEQELGQLVLGAAAPLPKRSTPISSRVVRYVALCGAASPATVAFCDRMVLGCPRDVRANTGSTISRVELHEGLRSLEVPTIVLGGRRDRLTPPVHTERMAEHLPQLLDLVLLDDVGHMAPLEAPEVTTDLIRRLVAAGDAAPSAAPPLAAPATAG